MKKIFHSMWHSINEYRPFFIFLFVALIAGIASWGGQIYIHNNEKAIEIIVNIFSILTGFLVVILTMLSEVKIDEAADWRILLLMNEKNKQRYDKHRLLFFAYLASLVCIFVTILLSNQNKKITVSNALCTLSISSINDKIICLLEYLYLWLIFISIIYSLLLPYWLKQIWQEQVNSILKRKKPHLDP